MQIGQHLRNTLIWKQKDIPGKRGYSFALRHIDLLTDCTCVGLDITLMPQRQGWPLFKNDRVVLRKLSQRSHGNTAIFSDPSFGNTT